MAKNELIEATNVVSQILSDPRIGAKMHDVRRCTVTGGRMRRHHGRILAADNASLELSPNPDEGSDELSPTRAARRGGDSPRGNAPVSAPLTQASNPFGLHLDRLLTRTSASWGISHLQGKTS